MFDRTRGERREEGIEVFKINEEKPSSNGKRMFVINHDITDQPELINERENEDIRYALEVPIETDEDLTDLGCVKLLNSKSKNLKK